MSPIPWESGWNYGGVSRLKVTGLNYCVCANGTEMTHVKNVDEKLFWNKIYLFFNKTDRNSYVFDRCKNTRRLDLGQKDPNPQKQELLVSPQRNANVKHYYPRLVFARTLVILYIAEFQPWPVKGQPHRHIFKQTLCRAAKIIWRKPSYISSLNIVNNP